MFLLTPLKNELKIRIMRTDNPHILIQQVADFFKTHVKPVQVIHYCVSCYCKSFLTHIAFPHLFTSFMDKVDDDAYVVVCSFKLFKCHAQFLLEAWVVSHDFIKSFKCVDFSSD